MSEQKQPTEYMGEPTYQTGATRPPKSHGGLIAFLLSAAIFFCGISTILSLMRINLLQKSSAPTDSMVAFSVQPSDVLGTEPCSLGILGQTLPDFWREYRALPEGVFITYAQAGQGILAGDILQTINGQTVTSWDQLLSVLEQYAPGQQVTVTIYREGTNQQIRMTIER